MQYRKLIEKLKTKNYHKVIEPEYFNHTFNIIDLSRQNEALKKIDLSNPKEFTKYIKNREKETGAKFTIGRYDEDRQIYDHSSVFEGDSRRSVHIGLDLFVDAYEVVFAPLEGSIHSFEDNANIGDYGPTIILEHNLDNEIFYSLYGHLSSDSIKNLKKGMEVRAGEKIAEIGDFPVNGNWPPHLHFQIILDLLGNEGDFYGASTKEERDKYLEICPDPNIILQIPNL